MYIFLVSSESLTASLLCSTQNVFLNGFSFCDQHPSDTNHIFFFAPLIQILYHFLWFGEWLSCKNSQYPIVKIFWLTTIHSSMLIIIWITFCVVIMMDLC